MIFLTLINRQLYHTATFQTVLDLCVNWFEDQKYTLCTQTTACLIQASLSAESITCSSK